MSDKIIYIFVCILFLFTVFNVYFLIQESSKPTFSLVKTDWKCTLSHTETHVVHKPMGKVIMHRTITRDVCDQYTRIR